MKKWFKLLSLLLVSCFFVQSLGINFRALAASSDPITLAYPDFDDMGKNSLLTFCGSGGYPAQIVNKALSIVPDSGSQNSSAMLSHKITLPDDRSFSTFFSFSFFHQVSDPPTPPADGLAFVLSNSSNTYGYAGAMGYAGIKNSIAVEFDLYNNNPKPDGTPNDAWEPGDNHIGYDRNGSGDSVKALQMDKNVLNLCDGKMKYAWVDYNGKTDQMVIAVSNTTDRNNAQVMTINHANVPAGLSAADVYAGFTACTGSYSASATIYNWYFNAGYKPIKTSKLGYYTMTPSTLRLSADTVTTVGANREVSLSLKNIDGTPAANVPVTLSVDRGSVNNSTVTTDVNGNATFTYINKGYLPGTATIHASTVGGAMDTILLNCQSVAPTSYTTMSMLYNDFTNTAQNANMMLSGLNGDHPAAIQDGVLQLTPYGKDHQVGDAFFANKIALPQDRSFSSYFTFQIVPGSQNADGFMFVLSNNSNRYTDPSGSMGFPAVENTIGIEFDTYSNSEYSDPSNNHIGLDVQGKSISESALDLNTKGINLSDGNTKYCWVDYYGGTNTLTVTVSNTMVKKDGATMTVKKDLSQYLNSNEIYAGFTASHYGSGQLHNILSWYFTNQYHPIDINQEGYKAGPAKVEISSTAQSTTRSKAVVQVTNMDGTPAKNTAVTLNILNGTLSNGTNVTTDDNGQAIFFVDYTPGQIPVLTATVDGGVFDRKNISSLGINLKGDAEMSVEFGSTFVDPGATAADAVDGDISDKIVVSSNIDTHKLGDYTVTYSVTNTQGQNCTATRIVHVIDTEKPVITLIGSAEMTMEGGTKFDDPGATAKDNYDGDLTDYITTVRKFNPYMVGDQPVIYQVNDSHGNSAIPVTRIVHVIDTTKPTIKLVGDSTATVAQGSEYLDSGAMAFDNCDNDITNKVVMNGSVDTSRIGDYVLTYHTTDQSGNVSTTISRTVYVVAAPPGSDNGNNNNGGNTLTPEGSGTATGTDNPNTGTTTNYVTASVMISLMCAGLAVTMKRKR